MHNVRGDYRIQVHAEMKLSLVDVKESKQIVILLRLDSTLNCDTLIDVQVYPCWRRKMSLARSERLIEIWDYTLLETHIKRIKDIVLVSKIGKSYRTSGSQTTYKWVTNLSIHWNHKRIKKFESHTISDFVLVLIFVVINVVFWIITIHGNWMKNTQRKCSFLYLI